MQWFPFAFHILVPLTVFDVPLASSTRSSTHSCFPIGGEPLYWLFGCSFTVILIRLGLNAGGQFPPLAAAVCPQLICGCLFGEAFEDALRKIWQDVFVTVVLRIARIYLQIAVI